MMKQKIYVETSVVSYLVAKPSKNLVIAAHQASTMDMWNKIDDFDVYISDIVIQEASNGDKIQASRHLQIIQKFPVLEMGVTSRPCLRRSELARECNGRQQASVIREQARSYRHFKEAVFSD